MKTSKFTLTLLSLLFSFLMFSCEDKKTMESLLKYQQKEAIETSNIKLTKQMFDVINKQGLEGAKTLFSSDYKHHIRFSDEPINFKDMIPLERTFFSSFSDVNHIIENLFATDDYVIVQYRVTGSHTGTFMGKEPTGKKINYNVISIFKILEGKFTEGWIVGDDLTMMTQLGFQLK